MPKSNWGLLEQMYVGDIWGKMEKVRKRRPNKEYIPEEVCTFILLCCIHIARMTAGQAVKSPMQKYQRGFFTGGVCYGKSLGTVEIPDLMSNVIRMWIKEIRPKMKSSTEFLFPPLDKDEFSMDTREAQDRIADLVSRFGYRWTKTPTLRMVGPADTTTRVFFVQKANGGLVKWDATQTIFQDRTDLQEGDNAPQVYLGEMPGGDYLVESLRQDYDYLHRGFGWFKCDETLRDYINMSAQGGEDVARLTRGRKNHPRDYDGQEDNDTLALFRATPSGEEIKD